jgi:hypothetical protein
MSYYDPTNPQPGSFTCMAVLSVIRTRPGVSSDEIAAALPRLPRKRVRQSLHVLLWQSRQIRRAKDRSAYWIKPDPAKSGEQEKQR